MPAQDRADRTLVADWSVTTVHPCGPTIIQPHGEADLDVAADLRRCLFGGIERADIVVDLSDVTLLDCACLGVLVQAVDRGRPWGRTVVLAAPTPQVSRALTATGVPGALPVVDDRQKAVRRLRERAASVASRPPAVAL